MKKHLLTLICIMSINIANAQWTTANLSVARSGLSATTVGTKAFFAGGELNGVNSSLVDIYDNSGSLVNHQLSAARSGLCYRSRHQSFFLQEGMMLVLYLIIFL
ncbi:MAG: hypothetical protein IPP71_22220 [Bacteroidetes bacterium]|nr:hypothetical protein [Bacteroidota bacterium]